MVQGALAFLAGQMLDQITASRDVEHLRATADSEDRHPGLIRLASELQFEAVEASPRRAEPRIDLGVVLGWIDVRTTRKADAIEMSGQ